jgi:hypothetical protein
MGIFSTTSMKIASQAEIEATEKVYARATGDVRLVLTRHS